MQLIQQLITASQTWTVPNDWSDVNKIQVVGGGGSGGLGQFFIIYSGGGYLANYAVGGAGGGYADVSNLKGLKPGDQITVVIGAGGGAGTNNGTAGGTSSFGGLILATGGSVGSGNLPPHYGGSGIINLAAGSYGSSQVWAAGNKFFTNNQLFDIIATPGAGNFAGGLSGGGGGNGEKLGTGYTPAQDGQKGAVFISYEPSGTHQACVWIS